MANIGNGEILNDRFLLINEIGRGGFGITFYAYDLESKAKVILKILQMANPTPEMEEAFIMEEQIVRTLNSPYVVKSYGYFKAVGKNGAGAIAFEYNQESGDLGVKCGEVFAGDLKDIGKLHFLVWWMAQAASGVGALHNKGILHRDIKPENIIVGYDNHAKIIDFGLAGFQDLLDLKKWSGTLDFIAPEVPKAKASKRSDVYSLGLALFGVTAGRLPSMHLSLSLQYYLERNFGEVPGDIYSELDEIFQKSTSLEPDLRFADGNEMAEKLWAVSNKLRHRFKEKTENSITSISGGHLPNLKAVIDHFKRTCLEAEPTRRYFHQLDGRYVGTGPRESNRNPAYIFSHGDRLYQINADTLRKAMYRLVDYSEKLVGSNGPYYKAGNFRGNSVPSFGVI